MGLLSASSHKLYFLLPKKLILPHFCSPESTEREEHVPPSPFPFRPRALNLPFSIMGFVFMSPVPRVHKSVSVVPGDSSRYRALPYRCCRSCAHWAPLILWLAAVNSFLWEAKKKKSRNLRLRVQMTLPPRLQENRRVLGSVGEHARRACFQMKVMRK